MNYLLPFLTALIICLIIPLSAIAEIKEITTTPPVRCGLACVIETIKCDTKQEADQWVKENKKYKRSAPYQLDGSDKWWVDFYVTEKEANLI